MVVLRPPWTAREEPNRVMETNKRDMAEEEEEEEERNIILTGMDGWC